MAICVVAGALKLTLAVNSFTLAWTHSIEKTRWEEDYRVVGTSLLLDTARIRGAGAGMEPPADAVLKDGVWHYRPNKEMPRLTLANSAYGGNYELCTDGKCQPLPVAKVDERAPTLIVACAG